MFLSASPSEGTTESDTPALGVKKGGALAYSIFLFLPSALLKALPCRSGSNELEWEPSWLTREIARLSDILQTYQAACDSSLLKECLWELGVAMEWTHTFCLSKDCRIGSPVCSFSFVFCRWGSLCLGWPDLQDYLYSFLLASVIGLSPHSTALNIVYLKIGRVSKMVPIMLTRWLLLSHKINPVRICFGILREKKQTFFLQF